MQLKEAQQVLAQVSNRPHSATEALQQLRACSERAITHLKEGNTAKAQMFVEQGLTNLIVAFHHLNLDLEKVVQREQTRRKAENAPLEERAIFIFSDHAELRVGGELRGTIPLYSEEDYGELRQIAQLFECRMEHADHLQLDLFASLKSSSNANG